MHPSIQKTSGPCVILAGAGTGKTYTIVEKIKYLLKNKIYPTEKIVCLTFSNEAANSLRSRILLILEDDKEPIIKTFHSFCADLLRKHGHIINIKENFKILLPEDAKIIMHKNFKLAPYYCHKYISTIGNAKDLGITLESLEDYLKTNLKEPLNTELEKTLEDLQFKLQTLHTKEDKKEKPTLIEKINKLQKLLQLKKFVNSWKGYEKIKSLRGLQDYSDLNKNTVSLLKENPEISEKFKYIIVDEFQDTNRLQFELLKLLSPEKNITIVGDLNQSIYRFRGAYKENFNLFKNYFQSSETFTLAKSFRSPNSILKTAHKLIQNNYSNKEECFFVKNAKDLDGDKIKAFELENEKEETRKIIEIIKQELENGISENEICVMFRTHQQSRLLKKTLGYEQIPFTSITNKSLLKMSSIRTVIDYLKILNSIKTKSNAKSSWWNIIHSSDFEGQDSIKLGEFLKNNKENDLSIKIINSELPISLSESGKIKLAIIIKKVKSLLPSINNEIPNLTLKIYEALQLNSTESPNKENILCLQKFHELVREYSEVDSPTLNSFLHHLQIIENLGIEIEAPTTQNSGIRIMTQHATKGLEYDVVIISNLAQKRFPIFGSSNSIIPSELSPELKESLSTIPETEKQFVIKEYEDKNQLLEERRLCYVALTRTKERLYLTYAKKYSNRNVFPSQFLNEMQYKKNHEIIFNQDSEETYKEPKLEIKPASKTPEKLKFSPSSLLLFDDCQKRYEYKYIYNMPEPQPISWEAIKLGSFIHHVLEAGVKSKFNQEKEFIDLAKTMQAKEEWDFIELKDALPIVKVFFERNKNKYSPTSKTEVHLSTTINDLIFNGFADRIDFHKEGIEIIDYKTGMSNVKPKARNWQLGIYALAAQQKYGKVHKLTLDLLKKEKPLEFTLDEKGNAMEAGGRMSFNLEEVKEEILNTAKQIQRCYNSGFKPCSVEKNCDFCNEYIWGL